METAETVTAKPEQELRQTGVEVDKLNELDVSGEIALPSIKDLPESYRNKSRQNVEQLVACQQKIISLEPKVDKFALVVDGVVKDFDQIAAEEADDELANQKAEELKEKLKTEIGIITKARRLLLEGKDATSVLQISDSSKGELYKYGRAKNPRQWLQQLRWKHQKDYESGKQGFVDYQWVLFNKKVEGLNTVVREFVEEDKTFKAIVMPSASGWNLESPDFDKSVVAFEQDCKAKANEYRVQHKNAATSKLALQAVEKWLDEDWSKEINFASKWSNEPVRLDKLKETINWKVKTIDGVDKGVMRTVEGYKSQPRSYRGNLLVQVDAVGDTISKSIKNDELCLGVEPVNEDYAHLLLYCGTSREEYGAISDIAKWFGKYVDKNVFSSMEKTLRELSEANKRFPNSQDLMLHAANTDILIEKILKPGLLLSRAEQMKMSGEAYFASAKMSVKRNENGTYKLSIPHPTGSYDRDNLTSEQLSQERGYGNKAWFDEYNEACFSKNFSYFGDITPLSLCFSKTSLLSDRQFMVADGWHVFNNGYKGIPESEGFKIDLNKEPHLLVIVNKDFLSVFMEKLKRISTQGRLLGGSASVEEWADKHVMVVDSVNSAETQKQVQTEFFKRFPSKRKTGYFMPTGYSLPARQGLGAQQLITYKTD